MGDYDEEPKLALPDAKSKATPTAAGRSSKKEETPTSAGKSKKKSSGGATPVAASSPAASKKRKSSFQYSGTHVVAGCLAEVVMVQLGLFVYEGWFGEQTWAQ